MNETDPTVPPASLYSLLAGRRSVRRYRPDPVPADIVQRLVQAAAAAPSAHNRQPWRYVVVEDAATKAKLAQAMGRQLAEDRARDGDDADAIRLDVERSFARITGAPVMILACLTLGEMDAYPDPKRRDAEFLMAVQSTAMATQNLLLAAHAEGLGACWMCAPLFCPDTVRAALTLPADWQPQGLITLGYPQQPGKARPRKSLADILLVWWI
ncbi:MAG: nitroreductase family protein [Rhizobiales bacterium]|nr:nitroreductase family protein [Hyphomicrobiales bacterium]